MKFLRSLAVVGFAVAIWGVAIYYLVKLGVFNDDHSKETDIS